MPATPTAVVSPSSTLMPASAISSRRLPRAVQLELPRHFDRDRGVRAHACLGGLQLCQRVCVVRASGPCAWCVRPGSAAWSTCRAPSWRRRSHGRGTFLCRRLRSFLATFMRSIRSVIFLRNDGIVGVHVFVVLPGHLVGRAPRLKLCKNVPFWRHPHARHRRRRHLGVALRGASCVPICGRYLTPPTVRSTVGPVASSRHATHGAIATHISVSGRHSHPTDDVAIGGGHRHPAHVAAFRQQGHPAHAHVRNDPNEQTRGQPLACTALRHL